MSRASLFRLGLAMAVAATTLTVGPVSAGVEDRGRATPAVAASARRGPPAFRPGELIVRAARKGRGLDRALARTGGRVELHLGGGASLVTVPAGLERSVAARLSADPEVAYAEPNFFLTASSHSADEMPWGVRRTGAAAVWNGPHAATGDGARVAVVDSGVDAAHPQLPTVTAGYDAYEGDGRDDCGHGTAVAGVVAAAHDGEQIVGVAPAATIVPVKVLRFDEFYGVCGGDNASIIRGIRWAANPAGGNADIINMSFGGPAKSDALRDAVEYAAGQGALLVAASGNTGDRSVSYPAAYPQVISVGGIERADGGVRWWPYSTFGSVDVAAPARGVSVLAATNLRRNPVLRRCGNDAYVRCSDGTSFAAPHVAGVAALLYEQHEELAGASPGARVRRLRQWVLATAPRVDGATAGVDLKTGHGYADAAQASDASEEPGRTLLTWQAGARVLAPTSRMPTPATLSMRIVATTGTGLPLQGRRVSFTPAARGSVSPTSATTDSSGYAPVTFRSTAGGQRTRLTAAMAGRTLAIDTYVLQYDDNVPGITPPAPPFRGRLNVVTDVDDVFRFNLGAGETLRVDATEVDDRREMVALYLHRGETRDVADPYRAPLREDSGFGEDPLRLARTVKEDGVRFLDVYGYGSYRLRWWIAVPGRVHSLSATPTALTPDGDGNGDTTRLRWALQRHGTVTLQVRNASGNVVRRVNFGEESSGWGSYRWNGRNNSGNLVGAGTYRITVEWRNDRSRRSSDTAKVTVER